MALSFNFRGTRNNVGLESLINVSEVLKTKKKSLRKIVDIQKKRKKLFYKKYNCK